MKEGKEDLELSGGADPRESGRCGNYKVGELAEMEEDN